jgi:citrate synthase
MKSIYLNAQEAADALGVTRATLYAYTSRGQLRSEAVPGQPRTRRYYREEIERLRERKEGRRDPAKAAQRGLHWGSPVLESGITLIEKGKLYYRGQDALRLARTNTLEEVAKLLWMAEPGEKLFEQPAVLSARQFRSLRAAPLAAMQTVLPLAGSADLAAYDLTPAGVRLTGARILGVLTTAITGGDSNLPVHGALQAAWAPKKPAVRDLIRAALVLCADHELNASAFVARCAASAGASPYDVVSAALATLKGHRHGGETERLSALLEEIGKPERCRVVVANRLRHGERIPGFGHPLYSEGDPRAALLLNLAEAAGNQEQWRLLRQLKKAAWELLHLHPNLDCGLVAVARTYGLPEHAPLVLFALGRTVGWIAHSIEQYALGELIRPRARYTGPPPA